MTTTYKHFDLALRPDGAVAVHDPRWPDRALYVASDADDARKFVRSYRAGATWAAQAVLA